MPYLCCRSSFLFIVALLMSPELRYSVNRIATFQPLRRQRKQQPECVETSWDRGLPRFPIVNYSWDDDGEYVRVRVHYENEGVTEEDVKADMTPLGFDLKVRTAKAVYELQIPKLNNIIEKDNSGVRVNPETGKIVLKLKKWHDSTRWRTLADSGQHPATDSL